ncbi:DNA primase family protein [Vibrio litoralis]|uniref:DNA primase family protein n=1 Tax=Vibrio litoralis TaxID=335972 RepID=UPI001865CAC5|nr:primase-like DNA-binding domain-containing protein [Vibrio litoralis]
MSLTIEQNHQLTNTQGILSLDSLTIYDVATVYFFYHSEPELQASAFKQATDSVIVKVMVNALPTSEEKAIQLDSMGKDDRKEWLVSNLADRACIDALLMMADKAKAFRETYQDKVSILPVVAKERPDDNVKISQMAASQRASLLIERLSPLAINDAAETLYQFKGGIWERLEESRAYRTMIDIFNEHDTPYSKRAVSAAVDTAKLQAHIMKDSRKGVISFLNGVYDIASASFETHSPDNWLTTHNGIEYTPPAMNEALESHAPHFTKWIEHASQNNSDKLNAIKAALYMVLTNRSDWQLFIEVTGQGGSGKSVFSAIATLLAGEQNTATGNMRSLDEPQGRAQFINKRLILLPDQSKYVGDGNGIKAITGGDSVEINPKYEKQFSSVISAVVMGVNNEPMSFTERQGGIARRRVIFCFNQVVKPQDKDPKLVDKIKKELPVIVRHLLALYREPKQAKNALEQQRDSQEALGIKQASDPLYAFCGHIVALAEATGMLMGINSQVRRPRIFLYHAYLEYLESHGFKRPLSVTAFGQAFPKIMEEYGSIYIKKKTKQGYRYNMDLKETADEWLPSIEYH